MASNFVGKWKMESSENCKEYMKEIGACCAMQNMAGKATPILHISMDGDGTMCMKFETPCKTHEAKFKLGEEFDNTTLDGRNTKNVVTLEDGTLVHKETWDGKSATMEKKIVDGKLVTKCMTGNVVATKTFTKED
ncbi:fatty acid-binding protein 9-like [Genypterus blacodes]|uniref:fatty acid-binding protein 9-like n=1 Tax=Genypterus blacodes TaxID=154954 RepID=UPI003F761F35